MVDLSDNGGTCTCESWEHRRTCRHLAVARWAAWSARGWVGPGLYDVAGSVQYLTSFAGVEAATWISD